MNLIAHKSLKSTNKRIFNTLILITFESGERKHPYISKSEYYGRL